MAQDRSILLSPDMQAGKAATKAMVQAFGGQEAAATETGRRRQWLSDCGLPNTADFISIDVVAQIEDRTVGLPGWPHVTTWLARRTGHVLVRRPEAAADADGVLRSVMAINVELGDLSRCVEDITRDDVIDRAEAWRALNELSELEMRCAGLRVQLEKLAERY